jgi:hypothetical protein
VAHSHNPCFGTGKHTIATISSDNNSRIWPLDRIQLCASILREPLKFPYHKERGPTDASGAYLQKQNMVLVVIVKILKLWLFLQECADYWTVDCFEIDLITPSLLLAVMPFNRSSPQVLGNMKGVVASIVSIIIFQNQVSFWGASGYAIAVGGVFAYGHSKNSGAQPFSAHQLLPSTPEKPSQGPDERFQRTESTISAIRDP